MVRLETERITPLEEAEKKVLVHALRLSRGNISKAAKGLGIGRATLYRKIDRYGLVKRKFNKYRLSE